MTVAYDSTIGIAAIKELIVSSKSLSGRGLYWLIVEKVTEILERAMSLQLFK